MRAQVCQPARSQSTGMQTSFHRKAVPEASTAAAAQCHAGCLSTALGAANHHHRSTIAAGSKVTGRRCLTPHAHQAAAAHSICSSPSSSPDTAGSSGPTADAHSKDAGNAVSDSNSTDDSTDDSTDTGTTVKARIYPKLGKLSYRMIVSYDGTAYSGWQLQSRARTIQGEIERALSTVLREDRQTLCVCAAGRTDAGVHAVGQVVQFMTNVTTIDPECLPYKLNSLLPHDIRVCWMSQTAPDFNVTVSAKHKTYHYNLDAGACHDPLRLRYSYHVRKPVDLEAMQAAAKQLLGIHDFTQFSNDSVERLRRNPVKTLLRYDVVPVAHNHVRLEVQGTGFLYKQVRHMTGVLLAVGQGKMNLEHVQQLLEIGNRQPPGAGGVWRGYNVAPAKGLQLYEITYPAGADDPSTLLYPELHHDEYGRLLSRIPGASSVDEE